MGFTSNRVAFSALTLVFAFLTTAVVSVPVSASQLAQRPFTVPYKPVQTMIVMARNHRLYYEAYNDASDINGDGIVDVRFNPTIEYTGYFSTNACYDYDSKEERFVPAGKVLNGSLNTCSGQWSGNFLNYVTTSRMDLLRKSLYGGYRAIDTDSLTVLERSYIPQDAHSWAKEYDPVIDTHYSISDYTPLTEPPAGSRHLIANTTLSGKWEPLMRVLTNTQFRVWDWVSKERMVAGSECGVQSRGSCTKGGAVMTDYIVRVEVCSADYENDCQEYPSGYSKPVGVLHNYVGKPHMKFGLLTGSYENNQSGGVLRKNIASLGDEVDDFTGQFTERRLGGESIINAIDRLHFVDFGGSTHQNCGWITNGPFGEGRCEMWGNPVAEMAFETLRYFAGKDEPTKEFAQGVKDTKLKDDDGKKHNTSDKLGLPLPEWRDPFEHESSYCARSVQLLVTDTEPTYDGDALPGSPFADKFVTDLNALDVSAEADFIWEEEIGGSKDVVIGAVGGNSDYAPTAKNANTFANIRGLSPESPTKEGTYHTASVAYFGRYFDLRDDIPGKQNVRTFAMALPSNIPSISFPVGPNNTVVITPFGKSTGGGIKADKDKFQPTNTIVDFYVEEIFNITGAPHRDDVNDGRPYAVFRVNFEDVEQGADHDMDAIVKYTIKLNEEGKVVMELDSEYAAGGIQQHLGYTIAGTTADGLYLEVHDQGQGPIHYYLNTPPGMLPGECVDRDDCLLPLKTTRVFEPSGSSEIVALKDPLWYAAKWGGFDSIDSEVSERVVPSKVEWDEDDDGVPDSYVRADDMAGFRNGLIKLLGSIENLSASSTDLAINSNSLSTESAVFQASYSTETWHGDVQAQRLKLSDSATPSFTFAWSAANKLDKMNIDARNIYVADLSDPDAETLPPNETLKKASAFKWNQISAYLKKQLHPSSEAWGKRRLAYLRGSHDLERTDPTSSKPFRYRKSRLGDIVNSSPQYFHQQDFGYGYLHATEAFKDISSYGQFRQSAGYLSRDPVVVVGANDGMLHFFDASLDASGGDELFAFIPASVMPQLKKLTQRDYQHQYFVDGTPLVGDAWLGSSWEAMAVATGGAGAKSVFAINISNTQSMGAGNFMWEFRNSKLGNMVGQPVLAPMYNGKFVVAVSSGYHYPDPGGEGGYLWLIDAKTGTLIKAIQLKESGNLTSPLAVDEDGDTIVDKILLGDDKGNLWRVNVKSSSVSDWKDQSEPLFVAVDKSGNTQPITMIPNATLNENRDTLVVFGTGSYIKNGDNIVGVDPQVQSFYGIIDNGELVQRDELLVQSIVSEKSLGTFNLRVVSDHKLETDHKGWVLDLIYEGVALGERSIHQPDVREGRLIFTTLVPSEDSCQGGGYSWLMELNVFDGSRFGYPVLDVNQDGVVDEKDLVSLGSDNDVSVAGVMSKNGSLISKPLVLPIDDKSEIKLMGNSTGGISHVGELGGIQKGRVIWEQLR